MLQHKAPTLVEFANIPSASLHQSINTYSSWSQQHMDLSESSAMMEYAHLASVKFSNSEVEQDRIASYGESGVKYAGLIIASL